MAKTKDIFLNIAANPNMTLEDLASVGLTSENTMLLDRALYASNEKVQNMFKDEEGNFDEQKFNTFYDIAEQSYNILANDEVNLNLMDVTAYDVDNIFVDPSKRRAENKPYIVKLPNPDRLNVGVTRIGKIGPRTLSLDEIAQTLQVLLNPVDVANGADPIYGDSPNDSWFTDFWDTRVMAAWDEDGTHIDPVTGRETTHKKGDLKLNENGTYYYESLDGRSVYGKRILNKFNTLTTDGSAWNKYDFFDSDSIELKSIGGSIAKNLALVGSMFIPYVGWGVAAASVAHQSAGLFAVLGKMLAGADNPTLNAIEGWVKSTDRKNLKTEYAQQNMWCWENFIDLIGDTTAQLREQRAIFKFAPGIIKGDFRALSDKATNKMAEKIIKDSMENVTDKSFKEIAKIAQKQNPGNWKKQLEFLMKESQGVFSAKAEKAVRDYVQSYYKLGEPIAKAYMTAITVQDTFGEAIEAGASNGEATMLTLGYAAAEAALLSTDLGKWIMPELRTERQRYKMIAKKLLELPKETRDLAKQIGRLTGETKKAWAKRLFNIGKDIANAEYSTMTKTVGSVLATGLGEGVEEVSEEALADFSKSCFNLVQLLQGDNVRLNAWNHNWNWNEALNRYGMSFAGGIMGGSINAAASDYKVNKDLLNMDSQKAMQQLVYMTRNNELDDFWKVINKTNLASKELSTLLNEDGIGYKQGTETDNLDLAAKRALRKLVDLINSIINAENAKLDDSGLLAALINADPALKDLDPVKEYRMRALSNSVTAGRFLNEWNTTISDIVKTQLDINNITSKYSDNKDISEEDERLVKLKKEDLKTLQKRKDAMLNGERTREYVRDALFEMSHAINETFNELSSEVRYAEAKTGKKYNDISEKEKKELHDKYELIINSNQKAERIHELAEIYEHMSTLASNGIKKSTEYYENIKNESYEHLTSLNALVDTRLDVLTLLSEDNELGISKIQEVLNNDYQEDLMDFKDDPNLAFSIHNIRANLETDINKIVKDRSEDLLSLDEKTEIGRLQIQASNAIKEIIYDSTVNDVIKASDELLKIGFAHPEVKNQIYHMIEVLKKKALDNMDMAEYTEDDAAYNKHELIFNNLLEKQSKIKELSHTPIIDNLKQLQLVTNIDNTVIDLVESLITKENKESSDISIFLLENTTLEQFKQAKDLLTLYRSAIVGARYDNIDLDNIVGFNTTLNELSGKQENPKLAEIDALTADLILEDINLLLKRLDYSEGLHNLNTGNKYNVLNKTALNKQFILYHKLKTFVSVLGDDEWKSDERTELETLLERESILKQFAGDGNYNTRDFTLNPELKILAEKESLEILHALHKFLNKHIDGSEASINKLAKLLTYNNFKGLIRENNEFLSQDSLDIDDSAFIWWLCATAALDPHQFYNNYRQILGLEKEGEKPIAPIPTQELGTFALTAAVVNGDMFKIFGKALRKSLNEFWENAEEPDRDKIRQLYGENLLYQDSDKLYFKNNDFLPNFDNIIFVEGIAGSGKSTGVLKSWSKLLAKTNPDFIQQKIIFAHTDKEKAKGLAETTEFTNFEAHDHDSLLSYMSSKYKPTSEYVLNTDVELVEGVFQAKNWDLNVYNHNDVPKTIVIDEWSHYDQLEQELIQRFASTYGVTVIALGDYDLLTASAKIVEKPGDKDAKFDITPTRNMTARVAKLGVSMRTDNEIKNGNMYRMLAWRLNPTSSIDLHYYEDNTGIYGDKNYRIGNSYGSTLDSIKKDIQKMISTLKEGQKIGYIYHNVDSELYKWIMSDPEIKKYILEYQEKDAHGREALYYIVENNRSKGLDAKDYFSSVYTGITRSELGSIVITSEYVVQNSSINNRHNKEGISFKTVLDTAMLPNTYTDEGTRNFTRNRINTFNEIYGNTEVTAFDIKPRTRQAIPTPSSSTSSTPTSSTPTSSPNPSPNPTPSTPAPSTPTPSTPTPSPSSSNGTDSGSTPTENPSNTTSSTNTSVSNPAANSSTLDPEREPESNDSWGGSLPKGQKLYDDHGRLFGVIEDWGEGEGPLDGFKVYKIRKAENGSLVSIPEVAVDMDFLLKIPSSKPLYNINQLFVDSENSIWTIKDIIVNAHNNEWVYELTAPNRPPWTVNEYVLWDSLSKNIVKEYIEPSEEAIPSEEPYLDNLLDFEEEIDEEFSEEEPSAIAENGLDIDFTLYGFTFNNYHLGAEFDKDGNIILELTDVNRIDSGVGLHNIDPVKFKSKDHIKEVLGGIRLHLEFSSNADILKHILGVIGKTNLTIKWAFISKNAENNNGIYSRYNAPRGIVEYMGKEDSNIQLKTISAVIYDDNTGLAILELPIITLQSPHSVMRELIKKGIGLDITREWANYNPQNSSPTLYETLNKILEVIDTNHANHPGYLELKDLIKLWLFTGNGFKLLPEDWNLSLDVENIGNLYTTYKEAYSRKEDNYEGVWSDIIDPKTNERYRENDRFISSIFMNNDGTTSYFDGKNLHRTFRSFTPYVLMSDDPKITTDMRAIKQYKKQLADPKEPKKVKLIPVSPPLVSVTTYIEAMERIRTHKSTNEPYGNAFTPYRIFDAILKSSEKDTILAPLSDKDRKYIEQYIKELNEIVTNNPIKEVPKLKPNGDTVMELETNIEYKKRIAELQRKVLMSRDNGIIVFEKLRGLLTEGVVYYPQVGTDERGNKDILKRILKVCDNAGITGILAKPYFESTALIGEFTYKVKVDSTNKYKFPGHGSFRIFGKIDPPTYNLKSLKSVIKKLAQDAVFGLDYYIEGGQKIHVDVWHFGNKTDEKNYYLPQDPTNTSLTNLPKKNTNTFNPENVRNLYRPLLARLGLDELNIDTTPLQNSNTELEALLNIVKNINQEYLKTPGTFIIQVNNKFKYGNIINLNTPEEYNNYKYKHYTIEDGVYKLYFEDLTNGVDKVIEITIDNDNNFEFIPENILTQVNVRAIKEEILELKNKPTLSQNQKLINFVDAILKYYDDVNNVINIEAVEQELEAAKFSRLVLPIIRRSLHLDDNFLISCANAIKIKFL